MSITNITDKEIALQAEVDRLKAENDAFNFSLIAAANRKLREVNVCDALAVSIAIQQAHAQGFAAGAAAQLAEKPSGYLSQYNLEMLQQGYPQTIVMLEGAKRDVPLYTRRDTK